MSSKFIKNPDEIILENVKLFHYEVMEPNKAVWMGIHLSNGQVFHLNIGGDNLYVNYSDEGMGKWDDPIPDGVDPWNLGGRGM